MEVIAAQTPGAVRRTGGGREVVGARAAISTCAAGAPRVATHRAQQSAAAAAPTAAGNDDRNAIEGHYRRPASTATAEGAAPASAAAAAHPTGSGNGDHGVHAGSTNREIELRSRSHRYARPDAGTPATFDDVRNVAGSAQSSSHIETDETHTAGHSEGAGVAGAGCADRSLNLGRKRGGGGDTRRQGRRRDSVLRPGHRLAEQVILQALAVSPNGP